jgi:hypothetical protein
MSFIQINALRAAFVHVDNFGVVHTEQGHDRGMDVMNVKSILNWA